jgi:hypothetical protein
MLPHNYIIAIRTQLDASYMRCFNCLNIFIANFIKLDASNHACTGTAEVDYTISTQTQDKKNRKKRAFLGINTETNKKKLKKLKATDDSKEVYGKYILKRCVKPPLPGEQRYHSIQ